MKNRQLVYLFFCNFAVFFIGGALVPLLPLYALELGATRTVAGCCLLSVGRSRGADPERGQPVLALWISHGLANGDHQRQWLGLGGLRHRFPIP